MKKLLSFLAVAGCAVLTAVPALAGNFVYYYQGNTPNGVISQDERWTRDNVYILNGLIYVTPGATLTIEPGTVIRGCPAAQSFSAGTNFEPGCLIVTRGAKIVANGTADNPIIFTSLSDPYVPGHNGAAAQGDIANGNTIPSQVKDETGSLVSVTTYTAGLNYAPNGPTGLNNNAYSIFAAWGGLVVLGEAPLAFDGESTLALNPPPNEGDSLVPGYDMTATTVDLVDASGIGAFVLPTGEFPKYPDGEYPGPSGDDVKGGNGTLIAKIEGLSALNTIPYGTTFVEPFPTALNKPPVGSINPGVYGGRNRGDNSGVIRYNSHRFGGAELTTASEINGLSLGGLGSNTVLEWTEVFNNKDDGFEFFGGFISARFLFSLNNGDDAFDGDQGYNGNMQFLLCQMTDNALALRSGWPLYLGNNNNNAPGIPSGDDGNNGFEFDGPEVNNTGVGLTDLPTLPHTHNFTILTQNPDGSHNGAQIRRGTQGLWHNGVVEGAQSGIALSEQAAAIQPTSYAGSDWFYTTVAANLDPLPGLTGESVVVSQVNALGVMAFQGFDPRLKAGASAAALSYGIPAKRAGFYPFGDFTPVNFAGGMRDNTMLQGWSIIDRLGALVTTNVDRPSVTLSRAGDGKAQISFAADTNEAHTVVYTVEYSTDGRKWVPIAVVQDNITGLNQAELTTAGYTTTQTTDGNGAAGQITVKDIANPALTGGEVRMYRAFAL